MTELKVYPDDQPHELLLHTDDVDMITEALRGVGVRFERWDAEQPVTADMSPDDILAAYRDDIERIKAEGGYVTEDVVSMFPDHPDKDAARQKFLDEHTHGEDEVRFFVDGAGLFCLHIKDKVYCLRCEKDDLVAVPAGTTHWFDMGPQPRFTAIRVFNNPEGWVAEFTGSDIAARFPRFDQF